MAFTFDPTTDRGMVRGLIPDMDPAYEIFDDATIDMFLAIELGIVKRAAAQALDTIAGSQALILKAGKVGDIQTDGPKVAEALMKRATALRESLANESAIDVAELNVTAFAWREILHNSYLRGG